MKYAIKNADDGSYVSSISYPQDGGVYWGTTYWVDSALRYESISDILEVFATAARKKPYFNYRHTIVGLEEVSLPRYKEIAL